MTFTYLHTVSLLASALMEVDAHAPVLIDGFAPTKIASYRGYYDNLAIQRGGESHAATQTVQSSWPGHEGQCLHAVTIASPTTVADLIHALDLCVGQSFVGYKGGLFPMTANTGLWVSAYGYADSVVIDGIETRDGTINLTTTEVDW